jgi:hypothetical protein
MVIGMSYAAVQDQQRCKYPQTFHFHGHHVMLSAFMGVETPSRLIAISGITARQD